MERQSNPKPGQPGASQSKSTYNSTHSGVRSAVRQKAPYETKKVGAPIVREISKRFDSADKFSKYKAFILTSWICLSIVAFAVANSNNRHTNQLGAKLIVSSVAQRPVYMVKNESENHWESVEIIVNNRYRHTMSIMQASGGNLTLSSAVLVTRTGRRAPKKLKITGIIVKTAKPKATVVLLKDGVPQ